MGCVTFNPTYSTLAPTTIRTQSVESSFLYLHCDSAADAVDEILSRENPQHIAFGETHPMADEILSTSPMLFFANNLFPFLAQKDKGFSGGVVEGLYSDDFANKLLKSYLLNLGPAAALKSTYYTSNINYAPAIRGLLTSARERHVLILGGSVKRSDPERAYGNGQQDYPYSKRRELWMKTAVRMAEQIAYLRAHTSGRTFSYGGGSHNDKVVIEKGISIWEHNGIKKDAYVEVDLLSPEVMQPNKYGTYDYPEYSVWLQNAVPKEGVTLVVRGNRSYSIIFPEKVLYVPAPTE